MSGRQSGWDPHWRPVCLIIFSQGWTPNAVGASISWAGTSSTYLGQGQLAWSNLIGQGTNPASFEIANLGTGNVPEPTSIALFAIALLGAGAISRRKN